MAEHKISDFRVPVEFQRAVKIQQADFTYEHEFETFLNDRAKVITNRPIVFDRGESTEPTTTHTIVIRHREKLNITRGMRVRAEGINFTIHSVKIDMEGKHRYLEMEVEQEETQV